MGKACNSRENKWLAQNICKLLEPPKVEKGKIAICTRDILLLNYLHMPGKLSCFISILLLAKIFGGSNHSQIFWASHLFSLLLQAFCILSPKKLVVHYVGSFDVASVQHLP